MIQLTMVYPDGSFCLSLLLTSVPDCIRHFMIM